MDTFTFPSVESAQGWAKRWSEAVQEEKDTATKVRRAGLQAQQIEIQDLQVNDASVPIMVAPSFELLATQGMQVRDAKNSESCYGNSMIFGSLENAKNPARLELAMRGLLDDTVKLLVNGMRFASDSYNLVIQDTPKTPSHDRSQLGLFDERNQEIHLFFFDFSSKHGPGEDRQLALLDMERNPDSKSVKKIASKYIDSAFSALWSGIHEKEREVKDESGQYTGYTRAIIHSQFDQIRDAWANNVTGRAMTEIAALPMEERLKRFTSLDSGSTEADCVVQ